MSVAVEGEYGAGKGAFLADLANSLRERDMLVIAVDVSRVGSSEPLLAHLLMCARKQLGDQNAGWARVVGFVRLVWALTKVRRLWSVIIRSVLAIAVYSIVLWYAAVVLIHLKPRQIYTNFDTGDGESHNKQTTNTSFWV